MKKLLIATTYCILFLGCNEKVIEFNNITIVDNLAYHVKDMTLITGKVEGKKRHYKYCF